jgi:WD40 repeat protein
VIILPIFFEHAMLCCLFLCFTLLMLMVSLHLQGALALSGMPDAQSKPVLLCSLNDNTARLYDLPSFSDRGRIFSKQEIRAIQMGPGGLFFTGDGTGELKVWQWVEAAQT